VPVALLFLGGVRRRHRRVAIGLAAVGLCAAGLVYQLSPFAWVAGRMPVLGLMTWARSGFLIGFAVTCLSALAFDRRLRGPWRWRLATSALVVGGVVAALNFGGRAVAQREGMVAGAAPVVVAFAAAAGVGPWAVPVLAAAETVANDWRFLGASRDQASPPAIVRELQRLAGEGGGRMLGLADALPPNLAARYGLADIRSADPVRPMALARLHQALGAQGMDLAEPVTTPWAGLAGAWGVRWLATPAGGVVGPAGAGWEEVYRDAGGRLYRNSRALPVVRLVSSVVAPPGDPATGGWEGVDFGTAAVAAEAIPLGGEGSLTVAEDRPWRHAAWVRTQGATLAVLHVPRAPGWRATLDGGPVAPVDVDVGAMGIVVPSGEHAVRWEYSPPLLVPGAILTIVGLLGCLVLAIRSPGRVR